MNKSLTFLLIILLSIITSRLSAQTCNSEPCPVVGNPYVENNCFAGIERYLARSISMDGLTKMNNRFQSWPSACMDSEFACNAAYFECPLGGFCPERYCEDISLLTELNIGYIRRAAHIWGGEHLMKVNGSFYNAAQQTVIDINRAYDCAGLRRPIIQAAILEYISIEVDQVPIPPYVINAFKDEVDFDASLYSGEELFFNSCRIAKENCTGYPDLNKIETRMWYYYLATKYLDFGYTALHMGQIKIISEFDAGKSKTYNLFQRIRNYASTNHSFVIIDAHTDKDLYFENTNKLLLDFNSFPIRPTDTYANELGDLCHDDYRIQLVGSEGLYNKSTGGMSPMGCYYEQTPYFVEIDHYDPYPGNIGQLYPEEYIVWGYDELNYFHNLSAGCKLDFVNYAYSRVQEIDYNGFFQLQGRHGIGSWHIPDDKGFYRLHDNPALIEEMKNILSPSLNIGMDYSFSEEVTTVDCFEVTYRTYTFHVENADKSSYLTWHIKKPDGEWESYTPGMSRRYRPTQSGTYTVYLRQDNLALPNTVYGTKTVSMEFDIPSPTYVNQCTNDSNNNNEEQLEDVLANHLKELKIKPVVYPNPTSGVLNIDMKDFRDDSARITLVDMLGRVLFRSMTYKNIQVYTKPLPDVPSGIYNLSIEQNDDVLNYKIVIEN